MDVGAWANRPALASRPWSHPARLASRADRHGGVAAEWHGADDRVVDDRDVAAALALDLGGSRIRAGVVDGAGRVVSRSEARTPVGAGPQGGVATSISILRRGAGWAHAHGPRRAP